MEKEEIYRILSEVYFSDDMHEKKLVRHLPALVKSANLFVDIGASLGQYTYFVNKFMREGQIVSIEADPIRYEKLESNCTIWARSSTNEIRCLHGAVSDVDGKLSFFTTQSNVSGGLFKHEAWHLRDDVKEQIVWTEIKVVSFTLDTLFQDTTPDVIKMDVEGSELRVLRGSESILRYGEAYFLIEVHDWADPAGQSGGKEIIQFMKQYGYHPHYYYGHTLFVKDLRSKLPLLWLKLKLAAVLNLPRLVLDKIKPLVRP